jgi:predicted Zn-ribbon and HTH transcriptional regulator
MGELVMATFACDYCGIVFPEDILNEDNYCPCCSVYSKDLDHDVDEEVLHECASCNLVFYDWELDADDNCWECSDD